MIKHETLRTKWSFTFKIEMRQQDGKFVSSTEAVFTDEN